MRICRMMWRAPHWQIASSHWPMVCADTGDCKVLLPICSPLTIRMRHFEKRAGQRHVLAWISCVLIPSALPCTRAPLWYNTGLAGCAFWRKAHLPTTAPLITSRLPYCMYFITFRPVLWPHCYMPLILAFKNFGAISAILPHSSVLGRTAPPFSCPEPRCSPILLSSPQNNAPCLHGCVVLRLDATPREILFLVPNL